MGLTVLVPLLVVCVVVAGLFAGDYWTNAGKIHRGVEVGNVSLGGKTPEQARKLLERKSTGAVRQIELTGPDDYTIPARQMGVNYNVGATVKDAYAVGRRGGFLQRVSDRFKAASGKVEVSPNVRFDSSQAQAQLRRLASRLDTKPREAAVNIAGSAVSVRSAKEGYRMDVPATMKNVNAAVNDVSGKAEVVGQKLKPSLTTSEAERAAAKARRAVSGPLALTGGGRRFTVSPAQIGDSLAVTHQNGDFRVGVDPSGLRQSLAGVYDALSQKAVEAGYNVNGTNVSVKPAQVGREIESGKLLAEIQTGLFAGRRDYAVPVVTDEPKFTTAEAQRMRPRTMLGQYTTNYMTYDDSGGRVENLKTGAGAVNGQLVAPGQIFSFNNLASQYKYSSGKVIINGTVQTAAGGGLCQTASTLYMAANKAGLNVVERHPHYAELPYIRPGFDATVWFGSADMKFKNNTKGYLLVKESVDTNTGNVHAAVYGVPQNVQVTMSSKQVGTAPGGVTDWVTYQKVVRDGKVVQNGFLHEDTYKPLE